MKCIVNLNLSEYLLLFQILGVYLGVIKSLNIISIKISNASKEAIVNFVIGGDGNLWRSRTGNQLVTLFLTLGFRDDVYDSANGGLPKLGNSDLNTSKSNYVKNYIHNITEK